MAFRDSFLAFCGIQVQSVTFSVPATSERARKSFKFVENAISYGRLSCTGMAAERWAKQIKHSLKKELNSVGAWNKGLAKSSALLMIGYMYIDEMKKAQFAWKRIPQKGKDDFPYLGDIWNLWKSLRTKNYQEFYKGVEESKWPSDIEESVVSLRAKVRQSMFRFIARSYKSITVEMCSKYLGLANEQVIKKIGNASWKKDGDFILPVAESKFEQEESNIDLADLQKLSDYVMIFEGK